MTCDPFPGRCRRCGLGLMTTADECGGGPDCRTDLERVRDVVAGVCSVVHRAGRRLGLIR